MHFLLFPPWPRELDSQLDGHDLSFDTISFDISFNPSTIAELKKDTHLLPSRATEFPPLEGNPLGSTLFRTNSLSSCSSTSSYENEPLSDEDENFLCCGSASTMVGDGEMTANHVDIPTPNTVCDTILARESDGDERNLSNCSETDLMIMPLTGITLQPQQQRPHEHQTNEERGFPKVEVIEGKGDVAEDDSEHTELFVEDVKDNTEVDDAVIVQVPKAEGATNQQNTPTSDSHTETGHPEPVGNNSETKEDDIASEDEGPSEHVMQTTSTPLRPALNRTSRHICSTCYLYAPSSSMNFYLDAWLNQQTDFYPNAADSETALETVKKPRKKVKWPSQTADLQTVVVFDRWIERGVHVYPHPAYANKYRRDEDSDEDEEDDEEEENGLEMKPENEANAFWSGKSERHAEKRPKHPVAVARKREEEVRKTASAGSVCGDLEEQDWDTQGSVMGLDSGVSKMHENEDRVSAQISGRSTKNMEIPSLTLNIQTTSSSRSSSSSSLSSLSSVTNSSVSSPISEVPPPTNFPPSAPPKMVAYSNAQSQRKPSSSRHTRTNQPIQQNIHQPQQIPKKKYASAVKVTVIGGSSSSFSSEHEAAMRIRGQDPVKNRAMIENYWQY